MKILILNKDTSFDTTAYEEVDAPSDAVNRLLGRTSFQLRAAQKTHHETMDRIIADLKSLGRVFEIVTRGEEVDYSPFDVIISVGGDGTFLQAACQVRDQILIGINSAPDYSVGRLCAGTGQDFRKLMESLMSGSAKVEKWTRLRVVHQEDKYHLDVLNDALLCHENPAALSRYIVSIDDAAEEHRCSGLWVSTPVGSSGAVHSAGGEWMEASQRAYQYRPRELYRGHGVDYQFSGGVLGGSQTMTVTSLMPNGVIYFDGAHTSERFSLGETVSLSVSPMPLTTISGESRLTDFSRRRKGGRL